MLKPFFTFYGGKWRAAPRYPEPGHKTIVEPFAGSAGYSLRYPDRDVILVEKDPKIAAVWDFLICASPGEIRDLPLDISESRPVDSFDLPAGAEALIGFWLNKGAASPCKTPSAWMRQGTHRTSFWGPQIRDRILAQAPRIKHWQIIAGDYRESPDARATWFVDPPYEKSGRLYRESSKNLDFQDLALWCSDRRGQTLVCEQQGADWLPFQAFQAIKASESRRGGKVSLEVLWTQDSL